MSLRIWKSSLTDCVHILQTHFRFIRNHFHLFVCCHQMQQCASDPQRINTARLSKDRLHKSDSQFIWTSTTASRLWGHADKRPCKGAWVRSMPVPSFHCLASVWNVSPACQWVSTSNCHWHTRVLKGHENSGWLWRMHLRVDNVLYVH